MRVCLERKELLKAKERIVELEEHVNACVREEDYKLLLEEQRDTEQKVTEVGIALVYGYSKPLSLSLDH